MLDFLIPFLADDDWSALSCDNLETMSHLSNKKLDRFTFTNKISIFELLQQSSLQCLKCGILLTRQAHFIRFIKHLKIPHCPNLIPIWPVSKKKVAHLWYRKALCSFTPLYRTSEVRQWCLMTLYAPWSKKKIKTLGLTLWNRRVRVVVKRFLKMRPAEGRSCTCWRRSPSSWSGWSGRSSPPRLEVHASTRRPKNIVFIFYTNIGLNILLHYNIDMVRFSVEAA